MSEGREGDTERENVHLRDYFRLPATRGRQKKKERNKETEQMENADKPKQQS